MGLQQADYFLLKHEELPLLLFRMTSVTVISSLEIIKSVIPCLYSYIIYILLTLLT